MSKSSIIALVVGALLFGCGAGIVAKELVESRAEAQASWTGQKWEYMCFKYGNNPWHLTEPEGMEKLNKKGAEGWELVAFPGEGEGVYASACFKRPVP
mgnify:CR=1 FL=1